MDWSIYKPYFFKQEFDCKHTGRNEMTEPFMGRLLLLRKAFDKPMIIKSGYRDPSHPIEARKLHSQGEHTQGKCCDIACTNGADRYKIITLAMGYGFHRIGVARTFIHIGLGGEGLPDEVIWTYS